MAIHPAIDCAGRPPPHHRSTGVWEGGSRGSCDGRDRQRQRDWAAAPCTSWLTSRPGKTVSMAIVPWGPLSRTNDRRLCAVKISAR